MDDICDVVIIGGGISGLYTAWRLSKSTNLRVLLLEGSDRFGGRFMTCEMPGGFAADLGGMRYSPTCHPIFNTVVKQLGVKTESMHTKKEAPKNSFRFYMRNQRFNNLEEVQKIYSIEPKDMSYFSSVFRLYFQEHTEFQITMPENGRISQALVGNSNQLAKDTTVACYLSLSNNIELINFGSNLYPPDEYPLDIAMGSLNMLSKNWSGAQKVIGGYENIIKALVAELSQCQNVKLRSSNKVRAIVENESTFSVEMENSPASFKAHKLIYACSIPGLQHISFDSKVACRQRNLKSMTEKVRVRPGFKLFLTYEKPWWENYGLFQGEIATDMAVNTIIAFGDQGKSDGYATLLASYSRDRWPSMLQGLDHKRYERFSNLKHNVKQELQPSILLVEYVENQLKQVFGCEHIPERPVCAVRMFWGNEDTAGILYCPKAGLDSDELHWSSLKPFNDSEVYITSDVFPAWEDNTNHTGFAESVLLTSERILVNYFGLDPLVNNVSVRNPYAQN